VINNLVFNIANPTRARSETPGRQSTPIKVEVARQYTKLTPAERTELARIGGCFRCQEPGHMARDCPCTARVAAITTPAPTPALDTMPPVTASEPAPASQDF
jgi:hypothetical protein